MSNPYERKVRHLVVVFGDQLDLSTNAFEDFDDDKDAVVMMEVKEEASYIPQHKQRLVMFFSGMRHFADALQNRGRRVFYSRLDDDNNRGSFSGELPRWIHKTRPEKLVCIQPGDHRVMGILERAAHETGVTLDIRTDDHFLCDLDRFEDWARDKKGPVMESFYRGMRRYLGVLVADGKPAGGQWNFDEENRASFGKDGPEDIKAPRAFRPDETTEAVIHAVAHHFPDSPGKADAFDYPVTRKEARAALRDFIQHRLECFGRFQDAMVKDRPYLYHSRLSAPLNLHLLRPREVIGAVVAAYREHDLPINSVEGFVRQILGWREYMRGIYWREMPGYAEMNALDADLPMPALMWTAETDMQCLKSSVGQLIDHAYAHHIQRLMVLGLFSMLLGVRPYDVHRWHMSMYIDAIDWVSLPNVLGMSQFGDGGIVGTKPYAASGNYINRMSNYCKGCRYDPGKATGEDACPFTTLYWDFLSRNRNRLKNNQRMNYQFSNLDRKSSSDRRAIRKQADKLRGELTKDTYLE